MMVRLEHDRVHLIGAIGRRVLRDHLDVQDKSARLTMFLQDECGFTHKLSDPGYEP